MANGFFSLAQDTMPNHRDNRPHLRHPVEVEPMHGDTHPTARGIRIEL